jgi:hypothetical protein
VKTIKPAIATVFGSTGSVLSFARWWVVLVCSYCNLDYTEGQVSISEHGQNRKYITRMRILTKCGIIKVGNCHIALLHHCRGGFHRNLYVAAEGNLARARGLLSASCFSLTDLCQRDVRFRPGRPLIGAQAAVVARIGKRKADIALVRGEWWYHRLPPFCLGWTRHIGLELLCL